MHANDSFPINPQFISSGTSLDQSRLASRRCTAERSHMSGTLDSLYPRLKSLAEIVCRLCDESRSCTSTDRLRIREAMGGVSCSMMEYSPPSQSHLIRSI